MPKWIRQIPISTSLQYVVHLTLANFELGQQLPSPPLLKDKRSGETSAVRSVISLPERYRIGEFHKVV
jgi:hypothetical protein